MATCMVAPSLNVLTAISLICPVHAPRAGNVLPAAVTGLFQRRAELAPQAPKGQTGPDPAGPDLFMRVLVPGGYGLIDSAIVSALLAGGHQLNGLGRSLAVARRRRPQVRWLRHDLRDLVTRQGWAQLLSGVEAVINAAGSCRTAPATTWRQCSRRRCGRPTPPARMPRRSS